MNNITKVLTVDELPENLDEGTLYITKEDPCKVYCRDTEVTDLFEFLTSEDSSLVIDGESQSIVEGYLDLKDESLSYRSLLKLFHLFNSSVKSFSKEVTDSQIVITLEGSDEKVQGLTDKGLLPQELLNQVVSRVTRPDIRPNWEVW